ncbi:MAG: Tat pathway signal protein, partial [Burkholderiaceae bacterium]|nr:Tat pathway signal protein [Burkholderiaceae bacterium]
MLAACSAGASHDEAARSLRRPITANAGDNTLLMRELVRYATLAPSSHNTQCWKFQLRNQGSSRSITIEPDLARRTPVVDPDDHHLFVSLGCATENLMQAALANGLQGDAQFDPTGAGAIAVSLHATQAISSPLFQAITERQCTRGDYDGKPLTTAELRLLEQAGTGNGVRVLLLTERPAMEKVLEYVVSGNTAQMNDPAFVDELKAWIRFSADEAVRTGDGLYAGAAGNPSLPRWLGSRVMGMFFTPKSENERYAKQIRNSAGIAVFASEASDKAHWVEAGRCY